MEQNSGVARYRHVQVSLDFTIQYLIWSQQFDSYVTSSGKTKQRRNLCLRKYVEEVVQLGCITRGSLKEVANQWFLKYQMFQQLISAFISGESLVKAEMGLWAEKT